MVSKVQSQRIKFKVSDRVNISKHMSFSRFARIHSRNYIKLRRAESVKLLLEITRRQIQTRFLRIMSRYIYNMFHHVNRTVIRRDSTLEKEDKKNMIKTKLFIIAFQAMKELLVRQTYIIFDVILMCM